MKIKLKNIFKKTLDILMKLLIFISIILWVLTIFKPELIKEFIEWIRNIIYTLGNFNYLIIFITSLIECFPVLWVVVPWQNILLIVWWFFANQNINNLYYVVIITSIWAILSNYIWYFLWIYYWDIFFKKYWMWFWIWKTEANYLKKGVKKWWAWWILIGKFHNLTRAFIPFIAGSMGMKKRAFFVYNVIWSIVRSIVMIILWVLFAEFYENIVDYFAFIMIWIMIITWIYIWKFKKKEFLRYIEEKNKEIEEMTK